MEAMAQDAMTFFAWHKTVHPLYERFHEKLLAEFPDTRIKVRKSQISYYNRNLYACVSFLKVRKKAELPDDSLRHQRPLRPERGDARLGRPGVLVRAGK